MTKLLDTSKAGLLLKTLASGNQTIAIIGNGLTRKSALIDELVDYINKYVTTVYCKVDGAVGVAGTEVDPSKNKTLVLLDTFTKDSELGDFYEKLSGDSSLIMSMEAVNPLSFIIMLRNILVMSGTFRNAGAASIELAKKIPFVVQLDKDSESNIYIKSISECVAQDTGFTISTIYYSDGTERKTIKAISQKRIDAIYESVPYQYRDEVYRFLEELQQVTGVETV